MTSLFIMVLSWGFIVAGVGFFITGSLGLLRFPDIFTRLHAVTKTDTSGLGLLAAGLALQAHNWLITLLLLFIWFLVMGSSAISCQLLARYSLERDPVDEFNVQDNGGAAEKVAGKVVEKAAGKATTKGAGKAARNGGPNA